MIPSHQHTHLTEEHDISDGISSPTSIDLLFIFSLMILPSIRLLCLLYISHFALPILNINRLVKEEYGSPFRPEMWIYRLSRRYCKSFSFCDNGIAKSSCFFSFPFVFPIANLFAPLTKGVGEIKNKNRQWYPHLEYSMIAPI